MTRVIVAKEKFDCEHLLGTFVDESHYDTLIESDTDCYYEAGCSPLEKAECKETDCSKCTSMNTTDERRIAFKFRKNFFTKEEQEQAYNGLREAAVQSQNRGVAAGPKNEKCGDRDWVTLFQHETLDFLCELEDTVIEIDLNEEIERLHKQYDSAVSTRGMVWLASDVKRDNFSFDTWLTETIKIKDKKQIRDLAKTVMEKYISDTTYANPVYSGIAGWFDRYPRIPYGRATSYTQNHFDKFKLAFPFLQSLNRGFKELLPWRWGNQKAAADKIDPKFLVPETVFTTITVNKTFRTACHRDAGDLNSGLSNLLVLSNTGNYSGGYLVVPEYRIAINVRPGDLLLINNHEVIHGNTPIVLHDDKAERISLVCYFREKMLELGSYEYENLRYEFVEFRRNNHEHPLHRKLWNGVSSGMWESDEWYDFLRERGGEKMLEKYHPESNKKQGSLEGLFG
jgi:hypothetical protein